MLNYSVAVSERTQSKSQMKCIDQIIIMKLSLGHWQLGYNVENSHTHNKNKEFKQERLDDDLGNVICISKYKLPKVSMNFDKSAVWKKERSYKNRYLEACSPAQGRTSHLLISRRLNWSRHRNRLKTHVWTLLVLAKKYALFAVVSIFIAVNSLVIKELALSVN